MSKKNKREDRRTFFRGMILSLVLALMIGGGIWWFFAYTKDDGLIYPNVSVFGVDLGGKTPEEAAALLREQTAHTYSAQNLVVTLPDTTLYLSPAQTGAALDVDSLIQQAYDYGRAGNRWENTQAKAEAAISSHELDTALCLTLDIDAIRRVVDAAAANAASTLTQPSFTVTGETPDLNLSYKKAMEQTSIAHKQLNLVMGTPDRSLNTEALMERILAAYYANDFTPIDFSYDVTEPQTPDLEAIWSASYTAPVDAVLDESDYSISHEVLGYGFDLEALKALVSTAGLPSDLPYWKRGLP